MGWRARRSSAWPPTARCTSQSTRAETASRFTGTRGTRDSPHRPVERVHGHASQDLGPVPRASLDIEPVSRCEVEGLTAVDLDPELAPDHRIALLLRVLVPLEDGPRRVHVDRNLEALVLQDVHEPALVDLSVARVPALHLARHHSFLWEAEFFAAPLSSFFSFFGSEDFSEEGDSGGALPLPA